MFAIFITEDPASSSRTLSVKWRAWWLIRIYQLFRFHYLHGNILHAWRRKLGTKSLVNCYVFSLVWNRWRDITYISKNKWIIIVVTWALKYYRSLLSFIKAGILYTKNIRKMLCVFNIWNNFVFTRTEKVKILTNFRKRIMCFFSTYLGPKKEEVTRLWKFSAVALGRKVERICLPWCKDRGRNEDCNGI